MLDDVPPPDPAPAEWEAEGLPPITPDQVEQDQSGEIDNGVPSRGYRLLPVVGLGGSAGSIPALQRFFSEMPPEPGMAFVVVLHLLAGHDSIMDEIIGRTTGMRVVQARNGLPLEVNTVYVIPPGKLITAVNGHLNLPPIEGERSSRVVIDIFFRTLADTHGPHATAIILSGADGDGALGIKRIKERGGLTIVQDPDEAEHPSMPRTAIDTGMVDWVLPVSEMPARLLEYRGNAARLRLPSEDGPQPAKLPPVGSDADENALRDVLTHLRTRTGHDFSYYKRATIVRRISRRMQVNGSHTTPEYLAFLRTHPGEVGALQQDLLISVTNFFRDREAFEALEAKIPALFTGRTGGDVVRVWSAGCATGEEAYSVAMLLLEQAGRMASPPTVQVFATDIAPDVIAAARDALFPFTIAADVSEDRLRRFFSKEHRGYRARRELRECVLFALHDLLRDAPFSRIDLFTCRNLLIYLTPEAQKRAFDTAHFALRPGGLLFIGSSESLEEESPLWSAVDKKHRIYQQRPTSRAGVLVPIGPSTLARALDAQERAKSGPHVHGPSFAARAVAALRQDAESPQGQRISWEELHYKLIERLAPPSVIVTRDYEIVHMSEHAGRFLHFSGGEPSINLLNVVHEMLRVELRAALFRAAQTNAAVEVFRVPVEIDGQALAVDLQVSPANDIATDFLLVVFSARQASDAEAVRMRTEAEPAVRQLEREIEQMKARLRDTVEQYEANGEELKASNEELQAMNEELRSTAEELETSREELQSVNEELTTVNVELKTKVEDLRHANADLSNLMAATGVATIFLDRAQRITRYTPSAVELFSLIPSDLGRPLTDLNHRLSYPDLRQDAERVLATLTPLKRDISDGARWYLAQLLPYRTGEDQIAGVVLTFIDITETRAAELALRESEERMRFATEAAEIYAWEFDPESLRTYYASNTARILGFTLPEDVQEMIRLLHPDDRGDLSEKFESAFDQRTPFDAEYRIIHPTTGEAIWQSSHGRLIEREGKTRLVGVTQNITARKSAELALAETQQRLRLAQEAGEVGIWDWDVESGESYWSETLWRLFGYTDPQGLSPTAIWKEHLLPEDRARIDGALVRLLSSEDTDFRAQFRIRSLDGRVRWLESVARITRAESGRAVRMMGVNFEITARKESEAALRSSEEHLRLIVENAREYAIFSLDLERKIRTWNSGAEIILGYTPEEAIGQLADLIFTPEDRLHEVPEREAERALKHGRAADERWHLRQDGTRFFGSGVMMSMHDPRGEAIGLLKIFRDQTVQLRAQEALERSRQELWDALQETERARAEAEAAGTAKDHFLAVLSHELRTPLTPILVAVRMLERRGDLPEPTREMMEMIRRNVQIEAHFIDDLLDLTRISRGRLEIVREEIDAHVALRHAIEVSAPDIEGMNQRLHLRLEAVKTVLQGDRIRLPQAFWNILKNASKFTPEGGEIHVASRNEDGRLIVTITDSGIGFAPDALGKLFNPFEQADPTIAKRFGGLGLGLAIAKATIDAHGGSLAAESKGRGHGATFTVVLPVG